jgi:RHS repeat-associated protein
MAMNATTKVMTMGSNLHSNAGASGMRRSRSLRRLGALLVAVGLLAGSAAARGELPNTTVDGFSGSLVSAVKIGVPGFRGIEPKLALTYGGAGNGMVGVGWGLGGLSVIERAAKGRGTPSWDATDIFVLDGTELVPGCTTFGGTHCTRIEGYQRITYDGGNNHWYVWSRDGIKTTYYPLLNTVAGTYRWVVTAVQDTIGNTVTYTYWCDGTPVKDCYPDRVQYNGMSVLFHYEGRNDVVTHAMGAPPVGVATCNDLCWLEAGLGPCNYRPCETLAEMAYRLSQVTVEASGQRVRAYSLGYVTSANSGRSVLRTVTQSGRDGSTLRPMTLGATAPATGFDTWTWNSGGNWSGYEAIAGDFNGDGKQDLYLHGRPGTGWDDYLCLSYGTGFGCTWVASGLNDFDVLVGDVNGDGKSDLYLHATLAGQYDRMALSTGAGFATNPWSWTASEDWSGYSAILGDFDGDGKSDLLVVGTDAATWRQSKRMGLSTGSGFNTSPWTWEWTIEGTIELYCGRPKLRLGDFNGDGKDDFVEYLGENVCTWPGGAETAGGGVTVSLSTGSGFTVGTWEIPWDAEVQPLAEPTGHAFSRVFTGDFNGDGKTDLLFIPAKNPHSNYGIGYTNGPRIALSTGRSFQKWSSPELMRDWREYDVHVADFNGDGRADLYLHGAKDSGFMDWMALSTGRDFAYWTWQQAASSWSPWEVVLGDYNGDGKADLLLQGRKDTGLSTYLGLSSGAGVAPDLLNSLDNGIGGVTTIAYGPSSEWSNTLLPVGMVFPTVKSVTIDDGRGGVQSTSYTYEGARFNPVDREFYGFRKAVTTIGEVGQGAYSETYYWQRPGTIAKPEVIYKRTASGDILSFDKFVFTETNAPPYTSNVTEAWSFECNGQGVVDASHQYVSGCRRSLVKYTWDQYANMSEEYQSGNYDAGGDERYVFRGFSPNTGAYIVGLPIVEAMYAGASSTGELLGLAYYLYDGATAYESPPTQGKLTKKLEWDSQAGGYATHTYGYDAFGNETSITDPGNRTVTREFDPTYHMLVTKTINPMGHTSETTWDTVLGAALVQTDPDGNPTTNYYDAFGRGTLTISPGGGQTKVEFFNWGTAGSQFNRTSTRMPDGSWVHDDDYFDGLGRSYKTVSSTGVTTEVLFAPNGKVWRQSLPYVSGDTIRYDEYLYDELGRPTKVTRPDNSYESYEYQLGATKVTNAVGQAQTTFYDMRGRITMVRELIDELPRDTYFFYDLLGRRTRSVDAGGNVTAAVYDSLGRMLQRSDPDQGLWLYAHDALGRVTAETDALGHTTRLGYDALGRVTRRTHYDGTYDSFTFDEAGRGPSKGRLTTAVSASGVTTRAFYDVAGRRTRFEQVVDGVTHALSHSYDSAGRLVTATYPDGEVVTYGYGTSGLALGRLVTVTGSMAGALVTNVVYTSKGQVASMTYANGVTTTLGYDGVGERVTSVQFGSLGTLAYGYDAVGRVTSVGSGAFGSSNWAYSYDSVGRLTRAANLGNGNYAQSFTYDVIGRMRSNTKQGCYAYALPGHIHAVTAAGANTYSYDANGDMVAGGGRSFSYTPDHRPASITYGGQTTSFVYDALGTRVKKSGPQGTVVYVGSVYEVRGGVATKYYTAGSGRVAKRSASATQWFHADILGSTRLITDSGGQAVKYYDYAPYGKVIAESGTAADSHRFTGQESDDETGLIFYHARYYDPLLARFTQPDALLAEASAPQALDPYAYALNSPVNYVDPSGHAPVALGIVGALVGKAIAVWSVTALIATAVIGTALTFTKNPLLQSIGMILSGAAGGALLGGPSLFNLGPAATAGLVAAVQSPISPLDPNIKKLIGWAYTVAGFCHNVQWGANGRSEVIRWANEPGTFRWLRRAIGGTQGVGPASGFHDTLVRVLKLARSEIAFTAVGWALAYASSTASANVRYGFAFLARGFMYVQAGLSGPLAVVGSTYDLAYTMKYPGGGRVDLSAGDPDAETFFFYYHLAFESAAVSLGRQHIAVFDKSLGGYWELGDNGPGLFRNIGFKGWVGKRMITVVMSPSSADEFRRQLSGGGGGGGGGRYQGYHRDSYYYISAALQAATNGTSAANLHINPGLLHW